MAEAGSDSEASARAPRPSQPGAGSHAPHGEPPAQADAPSREPDFGSPFGLKGAARTSGDGGSAAALGEAGEDAAPVGWCVRAPAGKRRVARYGPDRWLYRFRNQCWWISEDWRLEALSTVRGGDACAGGPQGVCRCRGP
jgi:hypothetical protein